jgi:hypothetical protein
MEHDALHTGAMMLLRRRSRKVTALRALLSAELSEGGDPVLMLDLRHRIHDAEREELAAEIQLEEIENDED